jgi:hypothetical protein
VFQPWTDYISVSSNAYKIPGYGLATTSSTSSFSLDPAFAFDVDDNGNVFSWTSPTSKYHVDTGVYTGTISTYVTDVIQSVRGEWVQFNFPYYVDINEIKFAARNAREFTMVGSVDGSQWVHVTTGSGDHYTTKDTVYAFTSIRVRFLRWIVTNNLPSNTNITSTTRASIEDIIMNVSIPYRHHMIYRLNYSTDDNNLDTLRPSEVDRNLAVDTDQSIITQTLIKEFSTLEISREGNVATHQEVDGSTGSPRTFSDSTYTLQQGYYYIMTNTPDGWGINLTQDTLHKHAGVNNLAVQSEFTGDMSGGQVSNPGIKIALGISNDVTSGPVMYPYLLANYRFQRV